MDDIEIYEEMIRLCKSGVPSALATIVESRGSSPRKSGAKMLVRSDGTILGSVGGGAVELDVIAAAKETMASGRTRTMPFRLTEGNGHVCGGNVLVYIEPATIKPRLVIIGAGHVGRALAKTARLAGFHIVVVDERPDYATAAQVPDADEVALVDYEAMRGMPAVDGSTFVVITTTGFVKDFAAVRAVLGTPARYIGVIGSERKRGVLIKTLIEEGFPPEEINRIKVPVGLPIGAETPEEIAVSILAQIIQTRRGHED